MGKVLIVNPHYYPGWKSGGPQRTVKNICDAFGDTNDIFLLTQNFDLGSKVRYELPTNEWIERDNIKIKYLDRFDYNSLAKEYEKFDVIYTCGLFSSNTRIFLRINKACYKPEKKFYVAPMGVFSKKAIQSKALKKQVYLRVAKFCGWFQNVIWSFTSDMEKQDAEMVLGSKYIRDYIIAEDMPRKFSMEKQLEILKGKEKKQGELKVVFLSRICKKKNLLQCANILKNIVDGQIAFDIYGVKEDLTYWEKCERKLKDLPSNIHAEYRGEVNPEEVIDTFSNYDIFLFPTNGENYGHVIYEALAAGCIPIISDLTPWKELTKFGCGNVISLDRISEFADAIKFYLALCKEDIEKYYQNAVEYANKKYNDSVADSGYLSLFLNQ